MSGLSFQQMLNILQEIFLGLPDYRTGKNVQYALGDAARSAFAVFFTQAPSFLAYQRDMQRQQGRNNGSSLFGIKKVSSDNQIRNLRDPVNPSYLQAPFYTQINLRSGVSKSSGKGSGTVAYTHRSLTPSRKMDRRQLRFSK